MLSFEENILKQITDHFDEDFIACIYYKYSFEKTYRKSIEVFSVHFDQIIWFNDWYEGQEDVIVGAVIPVSHAYNDYRIANDIQKIFEERGKR